LSAPLPCFVLRLHDLLFSSAGMEESGSVGLHQFIQDNLSWFNDVDYTCISDNYFLGPRKPCLTYGLRGLTYFSVEVQCAAKDLHSGVS
jgi:nonspecific dipeptidase